MSNKIYISLVTGLTPSIQLYNDGVVQGSPFSATEIGTTGEYIATVPSTPYGYYLAIVTVGIDVKVASGDLYWDGAQEITPIMYERIARRMGVKVGEPSTNTQTALDAGTMHIDITGDGINTVTYTATT